MSIISFLCRFNGLDQFVELEVDGAGVAVLRVLNKEDHQKRDDGGARVDDELPGVGVVVERTSEGPYHDDSYSGGKSPA